MNTTSRMIGLKSYSMNCGLLYGHQIPLNIYYLDPNKSGMEPVTLGLRVMNAPKCAIGTAFKTIEWHHHRHISYAAFTMYSCPRHKHTFNYWVIPVYRI